MPVILIVEKNGNIKESNIKKWVETDLYKKAGFKTAEGFEKAHEWAVNGTTVSLYGKTVGKAGQENKYDFPPPVDTALFFGSCILTVESGSLNKSQWETIYEELFGGFEDIEDSANETESDEEEDDRPRTKDGYVKDGFVVDEEEEEEEETDEEEEVALQPKRPVATKKTRKPTVFEKIETETDSAAVFDCTSELSEDSYE
jgi:hypothetical protein